MNFLIIDDDKIFADKLITILKKEFTNSVCYFSEYLSMNILSEKSYYAIFCDIILKENNGISIAKQIKEKYPKTPIIFISNHNDLIFEMDINKTIIYM